jgi:hypothetical protein
MSETPRELTANFTEKQMMLWNAFINPEITEIIY